MSLVKIARYVTDPRDGLKRKTAIIKSQVKGYTEKLGEALSKVCPRGITIDEAVKLVK